MSKEIKKSTPPIHYYQGDLFSEVGGALDVLRGRTTRNEMRTQMSSRLKEQRALTTRIVDKISSYESLGKSFRDVKRNKGAGGVDGVSLEEFEQEIGAHIKVLHEQIESGSYQPSPVRSVEIAKPSGGTRQLGIPTIADRVVQQSIQTALQRVYDPYFSESSYGFRPGRSAHDAIEAASRIVKEGKIWVVDIDLKSFFDEINHDRLLSRLSKAISDQRLLNLIRSFLKAGIMQDGLVSQRISGSPQGGPLSPLLSNIVLDELDRELESRGLSFVRYADDCNIFVKSLRSAERVLKSISSYIEDKLKLKVNREKSGVRQCNRVKFLGHTIEKNGKIRISDSGISRFKTKIRELTKRNRGIAFEQMIREVNKIVVGWALYYRKCNTWLNTLVYLDGWIRKRLRCYALKLHQRKYPTYLYLRKLGISKRYAWNAVMYRKWFAMANYRPVMSAMSIRWFKEQGLRSLEVIQRG